MVSACRPPKPRARISYTTKAIHFETRVAISSPAADSAARNRITRYSQAIACANSSCGRAKDLIRSINLCWWRWHTTCGSSKTICNRSDPHMPTTSGHTRAIRANKVIGTSVRNAAGESIGKVEDVILDKQSNNIMFAVVGFGGFLGMAEKYHPIPWSGLEYDESKGAYVVNYTKEERQAAPAGSIDELTRDDGLQFRDRVYDYYKAPRYWDTTH